MLINMLCMSAVMPVMAAADNSSQVLTATATTTKTEKAVKVPGVDSLGLEVRSAVLMEASTGQILLNVDADKAMPPASMTKMMTEYIVAEQVKQGKFGWDDIVPVKRMLHKVSDHVFSWQKVTSTQLRISILLWLLALPMMLRLL